MNCKTISLDAPIEELIKFYWSQKRGCCLKSMRFRVGQNCKKVNRTLFCSLGCNNERHSCDCATKNHLVDCACCKDYIDNVLMEIWHQWQHDSWWEFGLFFYRLNILGEFDSFFKNIDGESVKLSHMKTYLRGFRPGLVCIL